MWNSKDTATGNAWYRKDSLAAEKHASAKSSAADAKARIADLGSALKKTPNEKLPDFIAPELALQSETPPAGDGWLHELKLDGYRIQVTLDSSIFQIPKFSYVLYAMSLSPVLFLYVE